MKTPAMERTSAAKAGWLIIVLTVGWLVFLLLPDPSKPPTPGSDDVPVPATSLTKAGLRANPDWEGLPEIFAVWADKAEWKEGRTRFAYWHPVAKNYSYHFEARRVGGHYRFREIPEPREPGHHWDDSLGDDCPIRFYVTDAIPAVTSPVPVADPAVAPDAVRAPSTVPVNLPVTKTGRLPVNPEPKP